MPKRDPRKKVDCTEMIKGFCCCEIIDNIKKIILLENDKDIAYNKAMDFLNTHRVDFEKLTNEKRNIIINLLS